MTGKLPGDLASPVAGPILLLGGWLVETRVIVLRDGAYDTTGVIVGSTGGSSRMVWAHAWCETRQVALSDLAIPLDHVSGAGMDLAARWLSVHLGNWQYWEVIRGVCGHHATLSSICRQMGVEAPGRWEPCPPAGDTMIRLCLTAGGREP